MDKQKFIEKYSRFYFEDKNGSNSNEILKEELGIKSINRTEETVEKEIYRLLKKGIFNERAFSWKLGTLDKTLVPVLKGRYCDFSKPDKNALTIKEYIEDAKNIVDKESDINWKDWDVIEDIYSELAKKSMQGFGSVYIITSMYFLSKGSIPIYDRLAYRAIKALLMTKNPNEIYVGESPAKFAKRKVDAEGKEYYDAINLLKEYVCMIEKVFELDFEKEGEFVSRDLDQALWVYGHGNIIYNA